MTETPSSPEQPQLESPTPPPPGPYPPYPPPTGVYPPHPPAGQFTPYPYPEAVAAKPSAQNGVGTAALIVGILATLFSCTVFGGIIGGVIAIVLGVVGLVRVRRSEADNAGVSIAGIVLGAFGLLLSIALVGFIVYFVDSAGFGDYLSCATDAKGDQVKVTQCQNDFQNRLNNRFGTGTSPARPAPPTR